MPAWSVPESGAQPAPEGQDASRAYGYHHPENHIGACGGYVDADGDGTCDSCGATGAACPGYVDADGNGVCDNYGNGNGAGNGNGGGRGYVDDNDNDVCDNYENGTGGRGHHGGGHGRGHGCMR